MLFWLLICPKSPIKSQGKILPIDGKTYFLEDNFLPLGNAGGLATAQVSWADINNDGRKDLFIFDKVSNRVLAIERRNNAWKILRLTHEYPINDWALLRDINCDQVPDLFTGSVGSIALHLGFYDNNILNFQSNPTPVRSLYRLNSQDIETNIFVNPIDIPAIVDIDGDGDLDILSVSVSGNRVEWHENILDSCGFQLEARTGCFGQFLENEESAEITFGIERCPLEINARPNLKHSGTTLAWLDEDHQLLLGELEFDSLKNIQLTYGKQGQDSAISAHLFPLNNPLGKSSFLAAFPFESDSGTFAFISPNSTSDIDQSHPLALYKRIGKNNWSVTSDRYLDSQMLDIGRSLGISIYQGQMYLLGKKEETTLYAGENMEGSVKFTELDDCSNLLNTTSASGMHVGALSGNLYLSEANGRIYYYPKDDSQCGFLADGKTILTTLQGDTAFGLSPQVASLDINKDGKEDLIICQRDGTTQLLVGGDLGFTSMSQEWMDFKNFYPAGNQPAPIPSIQNLNGRTLLWLSFTNGVHQVFSLTTAPPYVPESILTEIPATQWIGRAPQLAFSTESIFVQHFSGGISEASFPTEDFVFGPEIKIFPNPSEGILFFEGRSTSNIQILTLDGKLLHETHLPLGLNKLELNLASGLYLVKTQTPGMPVEIHRIALK